MRTEFSDASFHLLNAERSLKRALWRASDEQIIEDIKQLMTVANKLRLAADRLTEGNKCLR